jgi:hypothetical protein
MTAQVEFGSSWKPLGRAHTAVFAWSGEGNATQRLTRHGDNVPCLPSLGNRQTAVGAPKRRRAGDHRGRLPAASSAKTLVPVMLRLVRPLRLHPDVRRLLRR